jgi:CDP-diacylglycerol--serine O-phosphatidyltransferase
MSLLHFHFTGNWSLSFFERNLLEQLFLLAPIVLTVFSALRLAKFNIDTRQSESFLGLTTTATGMFSVSMIHLVFTRGEGWDVLASPYIVFSLLALFCYLLVSEIPMFSLKFKSFDLRGNVMKYVLLLVGLISILLLGIGGIAITILGYLLFSIGSRILNK